jgi:hypothetical protein
MPRELPLLSVNEDFGCFNVWNCGRPWLVGGRSLAVLPALERAPKFGLARPGVGESAPMREPIEEPARGALGGSRLPVKDWRPPLGVFMPKARGAGDSDLLRLGVNEGG